MSCTSTWEDFAVELLRNLIGDLENPPIFDDERLRRVLVAAAFQVNREATFVTSYTVDLVEKTINPDPAVGDAKDDNFMNLICLKAACIIDTGKAIKAAGKAIAGKDMNALQFDLRGMAASTLSLLEKGYCATYKEVIFDYLSGSNNLGRAVMGPFRTRVNPIYRYIN